MCITITPSSSPTAKNMITIMSLITSTTIHRITLTHMGMGIIMLPTATSGIRMARAR